LCDVDSEVLRGVKLAWAQTRQDRKNIEATTRAARPFQAAAPMALSEKLPGPPVVN
jgi:hypothetical protein